MANGIPALECVYGIWSMDFAKDYSRIIRRKKLTTENILEYGEWNPSFRVRAWNLVRTWGANTRKGHSLGHVLGYFLQVELIRTCPCSTGRSAAKPDP